MWEKRRGNEKGKSTPGAHGFLLTSLRFEGRRVRGYELDELGDLDHVLGVVPDAVGVDTLHDGQIGEKAGSADSS